MEEIIKFIVVFWAFCLLFSILDLIIIRINVAKSISYEIDLLVKKINEVIHIQNEIYDDFKYDVEVKDIISDLATSDILKSIRFMSINGFRHILFRTIFNEIYLKELKDGIKEKYLESILINREEVERVRCEIENDD